jgi:hypothetical protein
LELLASRARERDEHDRLVRARVEVLPCPGELEIVARQLTGGSRSVGLASSRLTTTSVEEDGWVTVARMPSRSRRSRMMTTDRATFASVTRDPGPATALSAMRRLPAGSKSGLKP